MALHTKHFKPRTWVRPALLWSIALHLIFAGLATYWVVAKYYPKRQLTFKAGPPSPNPAERALQHQVQLQKKPRNAPPALPKRVLSKGAAKIALPPLPDLPKADSPDPVAAMPGAAANLADQPAKMSQPFAGRGGTGGAPLSFFGIRDVSSNVVIMVDVSDSMFGRTGDYDYATHKLQREGEKQSFQAVRDEAIKLVRSFTPATQFGIIRWAGRANSWKPELVPGTEENKNGAIAYIQNELDFRKAPKQRGRPGGTRHDYALEETFKLKPEGGAIYMLTDGNASGQSVHFPGRKLGPEDLNKIINEGEKSLTRKARINTIYYLTGKDRPEEERMLRQIAAQTGGKFAKVQATGRME